MVSRRRFLRAVIVSLFAAPVVAEAQQPGSRIPRVGVVADPPHEPNRRLDALREGLRELGYLEGKNIVLDIGLWDGTSGHSPAVIQDMIHRPIDVLVVPGTGSTMAAKRLTTNLPIVAAAAGALVEAGVVKSLAHPGGNVTGLTAVQPELSAKRLEILRDAIGSLTRVAVLMSPYRELPSVGERYLKDTESAARMLGIRTQVLRVDTEADLEATFRMAAQARVDAAIILSNQFWSANAQHVGRLALRYRVAVMAQDAGIVEAGGLIQYGVDITALWRRAAVYVDKILKGAKPADLPIEQPTRFELIVNLKSARALELTIARALLLRADQIIE
jgi:putative ABC transport system substrate-binding protein